MGLPTFYPTLVERARGYTRTHVHTRENEGEGGREVNGWGRDRSRVLRVHTNERDTAGTTIKGLHLYMPRPFR